jgi:hypothetical protein
VIYNKQLSQSTTSHKMENDLFPCPFNKSHSILRFRFLKHLIKCSRQYPDVETITCPFNPGHVVPKQNEIFHTRNCPDRMYNIYSRALSLAEQLELYNPVDRELDPTAG